MKVYLIGAGPGDPGLLTIKGKDILEKADVVVYDYLANDALLGYARPDAERIYVGKVAGNHALPQDGINRLIIEKAKEGKTVARLKGGDPYIFGRGGEEAEELLDAGVPFERRLDEVYAGIKEVIERTRPEVLAIEKLFYQHNQTTVIGVAEARGVILLAAAQAGLPIYEYTPMQVKQAVTGYGKAVKKQVQEMTRVLLHLPAVPKPDDTADALAMAITFCHTNGNQLNRFVRRVAGPI